MSGSADYTQTPNLGLYKPNYNLDVDSWGDHLNINADLLDTAITNVRANYLPLDGSKQLTGPLVTYAGTGGSNLGIGIGNNTTGLWNNAGNNLVIQTGGGTNLFMTPAGDTFAVPVTMGSGTTLTLAADPGAALQAATKQYVDMRTPILQDAPATGFGYARFNNGWVQAPIEPANNGVIYGRQYQAWTAVLPIAGGTLTGSLILAHDPTQPLEAVTLQYLQRNAGAVAVGDTPPASPLPNTFWWDSAGTQLYIWYNDGNSTQWVAASNGGIGSYLPLGGGTLTGPLILAGDPTAALGAATKQYADTKLPIAGGTISGSLNINGNAWSNQVTAGNPTAVFGILEDATYRYCQWASGGWDIRFNKSTGDVLSYTNGAAHLVIRVSDHLIYNNVTGMGGFGAYQNLSDRRGKLDIEPSERGLAEVVRLRPVRFRRAGRDAPPELGFIAQEVADIIPEAVRTVGIELPNGTGGQDDPEPSMALMYDVILATAVGAIQELSTKVAALEARAN